MCANEQTGEAGRGGAAGGGGLQQLQMALPLTLCLSASLSAGRPACTQTADLTVTHHRHHRHCKKAQLCKPDHCEFCEINLNINIIIVDF